MCCILLLAEKYPSCLIELDSSLLWCHCPCCNDCQVAPDSIFPKSPLCDNVRVRVTHTHISHDLLCHSFPLQQLFLHLIFVVSFSLKFLSVKEVIGGWVKLSGCHFIRNRIDSEQELCCQAVIIVITCGCCSLAHDSPDSRGAGHWLWHWPRPHCPACPPSCHRHSPRLTHRSVFCPDDIIIDNLHQCVTFQWKLVTVTIPVWPPLFLVSWAKLWAAAQQAAQAPAQAG